MPADGAGPRGRGVPGDLATAWLIARRAALESVRDRMSLMVGLVLALPVPIAIVAGVVAPAGRAGLGATAATYVLVVGVLPAFSAVGIAAGQFAGERERGVLAPLLASPASNLAIFGGKVLGSILPPLAYAAAAEVVYAAALAVAFGPAAFGRLPLALAAVVVALVPAVTCFAAVLSSLISSRVRTFNAAQQLGGLALMPVWGLLVALANRLADWGPGALAVATLGLLALDAVAAVLAAATWRREEVLAAR